MHGGGVYHSFMGSLESSVCRLRSDMSSSTALPQVPHRLLTSMLAQDVAGTGPVVPDQSSNLAIGKL